VPASQPRRCAWWGRAKSPCGEKKNVEGEQLSIGGSGGEIRMEEYVDRNVPRARPDGRSTLGQKRFVLTLAN
jgi:hypothetical protein